MVIENISPGDTLRVFESGDAIVIDELFPTVVRQSDGKTAMPFVRKPGGSLLLVETDAVFVSGDQSVKMILMTKKLEARWYSEYVVENTLEFRFRIHAK